MDAFIDSTIQLLIEWGLPGLFISALLAGSNIWLTVASMFAGKLIRYILLLYVLESAWNVVAG